MVKDIEITFETMMPTEFRSVGQFIFNLRLRNNLTIAQIVYHFAFHILHLTFLKFIKCDTSINTKNINIQISILSAIDICIDPF